MNDPLGNVDAYDWREAYKRASADNEQLRAEIARLRSFLEDAVDTMEAMNFHVDNPLYDRLREALEVER